MGLSEFQALGYSQTAGRNPQLRVASLDLLR